MNGEHTSKPAHGTEDRKLPDRCWLWWRPDHHLEAVTKRPDRVTHAVEYMRVFSRQEVDKIAGEGVDVQQYINSLLRTIEGQRRHIARLENPSAHVAAGVTGHD